MTSAWTVPDGRHLKLSTDHAIYSCTQMYYRIYVNALSYILKCIRKRNELIWLAIGKQLEVIGNSQTKTFVNAVSGPRIHKATLDLAAHVA